MAKKRRGGNLITTLKFLNQFEDIINEKFFERFKERGARSHSKELSNKLGRKDVKKKEILQ